MFELSLVQCWFQFHSRKLLRSNSNVIEEKTARRSKEIAYLKAEINRYGYKNNIWVDAGYGFIRRYAVISVNFHDSWILPMLLIPENIDDYVRATVITRFVTWLNNVIMLGR